MNKINEKYDEWLNFDSETKKELLGIKDDTDEVHDRFYKDIEFGTGGIRSIMGAGTNRLNKYTIRKITKGYAHYLLAKFKNDVKSKGVVIAHDTRSNSEAFTFEVAKTLISYGIKVWMFEDATTTPELSFTIPHTKAAGGIVITASHNPPEYNGYKIYDETGCQVVPRIAKQITDEINNVESYDFEFFNFNYDLIKPLEMQSDFINSVISKMIHPKVVEKYGDNIKILYTPLHGTGRKPIFETLKVAGFKKVYTVEEQLNEDPNFSTVKSPNPEEKSAFELALKIAVKNDIDLIIGTDPDCDRVGVFVKQNQKYIALSGNQIGSLLVNYMITTNKEKIVKMKEPYIAKTIVTSELGAEISRRNGVKTINTLTGFKYIGETINSLINKNDFLMGYEESFGYLVGTHCRDKDGVGSALLISEMATYYLSKGKTLIDILEEVYQEYGYYKEELFSIVLTGESGRKEINRIMDDYRSMSMKYLKTHGIKQVIDYMNSDYNLPKSNVLKFIFRDNSWMVVRPSGTEPKIKYYVGVTGSSEDDAKIKIERVKHLIDK
ncbi:phospho-sugar mutase [Enterococcus nangangensis]